MYTRTCQLSKSLKTNLNIFFSSNLFKLATSPQTLFLTKTVKSMESEASSFESSETLAALVASTPLLEESWKVCVVADASVDSHFTVIRIGGIAYVGFSSFKLAAGVGLSCRNIMRLPDELFSSLCLGGPDLPMVHAGLLHLFLSVYADNLFRDQMFEIMNTSKSVVITGRSIGGAIASLLALWFLCHRRTICSVICITFGSPMLGNESFSRAILQQRWAGNFCHVVSQHDIVPRLFFAPSIALASSSCSFQFIHHLSEENKTQLFRVVLDSLGVISQSECKSSFCPSGSYLFCTNRGAVCVDNGMLVIKLLYLTLLNGLLNSSLEDHLGYADFIQKAHWQFIENRSFMGGNLSKSSYEAGITLALESLGIASHELNSEDAKEALKKAKKLGRTRNLNSANLAIGLSKINPLRAQIEWYKASCDNSGDQMGYYDSFKQRGASKRGFKVNMNRIKLGQFWDSLIDKLEANELPYDFHKREKWVCASQFYKLLVEPLDIAEYYRNGMHRVKGHYMQHGRERRYKIFDKWWSENSTDHPNARSRFASSTQDSCFWAKVEEARDRLIKIRTEGDERKFIKMLKDITKFDQNARRMIENKEVSPDVLAKNSSYSLFIEEWKEFQSQLQLFQPQFPGIQQFLS
ncbi:lipase-like PAD4 isoform X2 [Capsicum annuum]|uniref:lipase-like PAD4 isoform X2 n=1 Tax=Capsicum annuum TaxID=4072 RepID=UPI001FB0E48E|nr:lipase-like PAD4 isoform X2 [Capsicum annuum]